MPELSTETLGQAPIGLRIECNSLRADSAWVRVTVGEEGGAVVERKWNEKWNKKIKQKKKVSFFNY